MEFSLSTLVVGSAIASDATRRIVELYDGELARGQKFLRFSHPGRRCPSFAPPDCAPGERRCQEKFSWPLPAFGRCFTYRFGMCRLVVHFVRLLAIQQPGNTHGI